MKMEENSESANLPNSTASASFLNNRASNIPSRCGSAPPRFSVEAYTSFRNSMVKQQLLNNFESLELESAAEERLLTDPSYIAYYNANVNLNPRLPPPLISRETRRLFEQALMIEHMLEDKSRSKDEIVDRDNTVSPAGCSKSFADLVQGPNGHTRAPGTTDPPTTSFPRGGNDNNMAARDSTSSTTSVAGTVLTPMNISGASVSEHVERKHDNVRSCETYRSMPLYPPNCSIRQIQRFPVHTQYTSQGVNEPYIMHMFPGINPNMLNQGFVPAHYMNVGNHQLGTRFQMMNTFGSQFGLGGHALPSGFYPPYVGGNMSPNIYTFPNDPYAHHNLFNRGTAVQSHFSSPLQGQYFQHPFMDNNGRHAAQSSQYNNFLAQKDSNLAAFMYNDHRNLSYSGFIPIPQSPMSGRNHLVLGDHTSIPQCSLQRPDLYTGQKGQRGSCNVDDPKRHTYLETLKIGGASELELSDIAGKIVEFSTDQHGSRFIQQKLENSTVQEKEFVFTELLPHASRLMIDVFGNYVIQKLFEHGTGDHRRQLADQFTGQMLTLSLQMYGCRVIQKGLEVIEVDQKAVLAKELDGHVIKCVHDQNGNHVIQKCIEHIPADKIGFIISAFHGEVATLSVHPYGCRVIQRALEHCPDTSTTHFIIREILESASVLAHDQYGNYVIQHILELAKPHERSQVIGKLTGKFVEMSQHKYASNVIEKCLMYGGDSERESLIKEIVGRPEDDANLVIMMKDQYANYVIQKVIEICNDEEKNILMNCLMENLEYLKKYTYGKHIVSRYEQRLSGNQEQSAT